eukprot:TRINITY_DN56275_c0_g1_i1.p1 TRINITY_DN56275_c0_g1~~TRINITY_DN56275_c0_g1_i1.p1  ORF type:complete len:891 (+),score=200.74 TRINITY_DN56275_c0_g1_i1:152-2824(+)
MQRNQKNSSAGEKMAMHVDPAAGPTERPSACRPPASPGVAGCGYRVRVAAPIWGVMMNVRVEFDSSTEFHRIVTAVEQHFAPIHASRRPASCPLNVPFRVGQLLDGQLQAVRTLQQLQLLGDDSQLLAEQYYSDWLCDFSDPEEAELPLRAPENAPSSGPPQEGARSTEQPAACPQPSRQAPPSAAAPPAQPQAAACPVGKPTLRRPPPRQPGGAAAGGAQGEGAGAPRRPSGHTRALPAPPRQGAAPHGPKSSKGATAAEGRSKPRPARVPLPQRSPGPSSGLPSVALRTSLGTGPAPSAPGQPRAAAAARRAAAGAPPLQTKASARWHAPPRQQLRLLQPTAAAKPDQPPAAPTEATSVAREEQPAAEPAKPPAAASAGETISVKVAGNIDGHVRNLVVRIPAERDLGETLRTFVAVFQGRSDVPLAVRKQRVQTAGGEWADLRNRVQLTSGCQLRLGFVPAASVWDSPIQCTLRLPADGAGGASPSGFRVLCATSFFGGHYNIEISFRERPQMEELTGTARSQYSVLLREWRPPGMYHCPFAITSVLIYCHLCQDWEPLSDSAQLSDCCQLLCCHRWSPTSQQFAAHLRDLVGLPRTRTATWNTTPGSKYLGGLSDAPSAPGGSKDVSVVALAYDKVAQIGGGLFTAEALRAALEQADMQLTLLSPAELFAAIRAVHCDDAEGDSAGGAAEAASLTQCVLFHLNYPTVFHGIYYRLCMDLPRRETLLAVPARQQNTPWWSVPHMLARVLSYLELRQLPRAAGACSHWTEAVLDILNLHCDALGRLDAHYDSTMQLLTRFYQEVRELDTALGAARRMEQGYNGRWLFARIWDYADVVIDLQQFLTDGSGSVGLLMGCKAQAFLIRDCITLRHSVRRAVRSPPQQHTVL